MAFLPGLILNAFCLGMNLMIGNYGFAVVSGIGVAISIAGFCSTR